MARALVPRDCKVAWIELDGTAGGNALVGFRCVRGEPGGPRFMEAGQYTYPHKGGGWSNYPQKRVKASSVSFRGMTVTGQARVGFVLSPAAAVCHQDGRQIRRKLGGDTSLPSLNGLNGLYVGLKGGRREVFKSNKTPTEGSHGSRYGAVGGPFK